jgi:U11/U12 small nuclear ribonucleoprotein SNRNP35
MTKKSNFAYEPFGDPKVIKDPYCIVFVGRHSHSTTKGTLCLKVLEFSHMSGLFTPNDKVRGGQTTHLPIQ